MEGQKRDAAFENFKAGKQRRKEEETENKE
jgi:hypothetical protein